MGTCQKKKFQIKSEHLEKAEKLVERRKVETQVSTGRNMRKKVLIGIAAVVIVAAVVVFSGFFFLQKGNEDARDEKGEAKPSYAMDTMANDFSGSSQIDTFASVKEAQAQSDPVAYMVDNSVFLLDQQAIDEKVAERISGMEASANTQGIAIEDLLAEAGYESVDTYKETVTNEVIEFVKSRMCVYKAAEELGLFISPDEYETLLPEYAEKYGFEDTESFEYVCRPGTIACEMLYDKTVDTLTGK